MLALRLWGRPGRENIRLLNQLTDADFEGRFRRHADAAGSDTAPSLLHRLQDDILDRIARDRPDPALAADGSITVLPCPGLRRELEVVAAEIWRMVRADPSLRFNQIAVIVPEANKDAYLSQIGAVFGESHDLPWSGVDLPPGHGHGAGEITEVVERLIDLPLGAFTPARAAAAADPPGDPVARALPRASRPPTGSACARSWRSCTAPITATTTTPTSTRTCSTGTRACGAWRWARS